MQRIKIAQCPYTVICGLGAKIEHLSLCEGPLHLHAKLRVGDEQRVVDIGLSKSDAKAMRRFIRALNEVFLDEEE